MKVKISELKTIVKDMILEAGKAKKKAKSSVVPKPEAVPRPLQYKYDEALDMSKPLGNDNLYKGQGGAGWGPNTSAHGQSITGMETRAIKAQGYSESHEFLKDVLQEVSTPVSHWDFLTPTVRPEPKGVWEVLSRVTEKKEKKSKKEKDDEEK
ncbi:MAG: hypothetical protein ACYDHY_07675 [Acidiferrobacterales bacterium]